MLTAPPFVFPEVARPASRPSARHEREQVPTGTRCRCLLDEPSTGLDVAAREQFLSTVDELHRSRRDLATDLVSECFDHPIEIEHRAGRWQARAFAGG
jgi:hypothetical protein